jgi:putative multiple sugar transport system substrate-binding protein
VEDLITKGVQVIIYTPHDGTAAAAAAEAARDAGVKVVSYDRLILDTEAVDYYVTFDSIAVGEAQAQYLVDKASGTGNPLYLYAGAATDNNAFLFFEGAWNVLQPKIADGTFVIKNSSQAEALQDKAELTRDEMADIIGQVTTNWDFNDAKSLTRVMCSSWPPMMARHERLRMLLGLMQMSPATWSPDRMQKSPPCSTSSMASSR